MKTGKYYKVARPDGFDFYTGQTINYRDNIGRRVVCPDYKSVFDVRCCSAGVIHASKNVLDALGYSKIPCSIYEVTGTPKVVNSDKCGFRSFVVQREIPESEFNDLLKFDYGRVANPTNLLKINKVLTEKHKELLVNWASVGASVGASVWASVGASVWDSVWASVGASVRASVWASVGASVRASVGASVWASVWAYIGSCFPNITKWKYIANEEGEYPFQSAVDLWEDGFIPLYFNGKWHLWKKNGGIVYTME